MTIAQPGPASGCSTRTTYDVIVVGGGFSGIYQLRRLRELGFSVILLEASSGLGGVWNLNRYPGARVDSDATTYQFSDEKLWREWSYSEFFPDRDEMLRYFAHVDRRLDLAKDCRFDTMVVGARFDDTERIWDVDTDGGACLHTRFLIFATGTSVQPYLPALAGAEDFRGTVAHTAQWPEDIRYHGKRVAVVGTGASGIQVIQEIGPVAEHLVVFQRTPNLSLPMRQRQLDDAANAELKRTFTDRFARWPTTFGGVDFDFDPRPTLEQSDEERLAFYESLWNAGGLHFWQRTYLDTYFDLEANRHAYEFWKKKIRAKITDPVKADILAPHEPPHPFGAKRPALHQNYYDVLDQDNVTIVPVGETPIERLTPTGIRTVDGREFTVDAVVMATGFDNNTGTLTSIEVRGTDGRTLGQKWADGVDAHLGAMTHGFPNMIFLYGPQSPGAFASGPSSAELQGEAVIGLLAHTRTVGATRFESTPEADAAWTAEISALDEQALFRLTDSWFNGANIPGKHRQMLQYPGGMPSYLQHWADLRASGYTRGVDLS